MFKRMLLLFLPVIFCFCATASEIKWDDYLNESLESSSFKAATYQFRNTNSYIELQDSMASKGQYNKKRMKEHYEQHDAFASYVMYDFYLKNGSLNKALKALQKLYVHAEQSQKKAAALNFISLFLDRPENALQVAYYEFYFERFGESNLGNFFIDHYKQLSTATDSKSVQNRLTKIKQEITTLNSEITPFGFFFNVKPYSDQLMEEATFESEVESGDE